jgi:PAS domain-containing protein
VTGRPFWDTPWWQACAQSRARLHEAVASAATGTLVQFRARSFGPSRAIHVLDVSIKPVRDADGRIVLLIPEGRDVALLTDQRARLRRETARLRNAQRIGRMGSRDFDVPTGRIHIHEQALELVALPASYATLTAAELEAIVHPDDRASRRRALEHAVAPPTDTTRPTGSPLLAAVSSSTWWVSRPAIPTASSPAWSAWCRT